MHVIKGVANKFIEKYRLIFSYLYFLWHVDVFRFLYCYLLGVFYAPGNLLKRILLYFFKYPTNYQHCFI